MCSFPRAYSHVLSSTTMVHGKSALFQSIVFFEYSGADEVEMLKDELHICSDFDFISQMATFVVEVSAADVLLLPLKRAIYDGATASLTLFGRTISG